MKFCTSLAAGLWILSAGLSTADAQTTLYWDTNGSAAGATVGGFADGTWDAGGTANWNPVADGTGTTTTWTAGDDAVFSAGNDVLNDPINSGGFITISGTQTANSILIEEGFIAFRGGTADTGAGAITINTDATLDIDSAFRTDPTTTAQGKVVLSGGELQGSNPGNAGSLLFSGRTIEVDGSGIISYDDQSASDNFVAIYLGTITGTGGTTGNGGAGTLIKRGPDRIGLQGANQANYTFAKLVVEEGMYQPRHSGGTIFDTVFGAVPTSLLPDAVTLNGGEIGANASFTTDPNRGLTIGPNGGAFNGAGGGGFITWQGPLAGSGTFTMYTTSAAMGGMRLQNANNTFDGDLVMEATTLFLDESLSPGSVSGTAGTISIAADKTLTTGSNDSSTTYSGALTGDGGVTKVGSGTFTIDGTKDYLGDTRIEEGTLSTNSISLADAADVYITTGGVFDLNFSGTDDIDQLFFDGVAQAAGTYGGSSSSAVTTSSFFSSTGLGILNVLNGPGGLTGDYNGDGTVDAADYALWRSDPASYGGDPQGYQDWVDNFGATLGAGAGGGLAGAVPEPMTLALLMLGLAGVAFGRRSR